jgi:hypothetical protein
MGVFVLKRYISVMHGGTIMKRALLALAVFVSGVLALNAVPLTVTWSDGKVDLQKGSSWITVNIGDQIDSASTIRLAKGASVEISDGKRKVSLTAAGSYVLDAQLRLGADVAKKNGALDKLGKLIDPKASVTSTAVAAVRGAAVEPAKDTVTWQSDTVDVAAVMEEGRRLVRDGAFADAALMFADAATAAEGDDKDAAQYAEAWALAAADSSARAVKILREMPDKGSWASPRTLLLARLDIDSGAKGEAKSILDSGIKAKLFAGDDLELARSLLAEASAK